MSVGVRLRFRSRDGTLQGERVFYDLPVRIGRNSMNDCPVAHPFVSEFHATIDLLGGELCVSDLNSRNGTYDTNLVRLAPKRAVPLSRLGNTFVLGRIVDLAVEPFEQSPDIGGRPSSVHGSILGNGAALRMPPGLGGSPSLAPLPALSARDGGAPPGAPFAPAPWGAPEGPSFNSRLPLADPARSALGQSLPDLPPLRGAYDGHGAEPPRAAGGPGPSPERASRHTQHLSMSTELLALLGLRELGSSLLPGVPLETTGDVARLLTKLHDLVEVFCRCFVALREGSAQFIAYAEGEGPESRWQNRSASAQRVATARDPATLALALLDWRNQEFDAPKAAEDVLVRIVAQHAALTDAVIRGVEALLEELSPEAIESATKDGGAMGSILGRHRALWQAYKARYESVAAGTAQFERLFGSEFAATFGHYVRTGRT